MDERQFLTTEYVRGIRQWRRFFTLEILKKLIFFLTTISIIIACIVSSIYICTLTNRNPSIERTQITFEELSEQKNLCETPECIAVSYQLLSYMDPTADPCEDFYQYACGGWIRNNKVGNSIISTMGLLQNQIDAELRNLLESHWMSKDRTLSVMFKQLKSYYYSCLFDTGPKQSDVKSTKSFIHAAIDTNFRAHGPLTDLFIHVLKFSSFSFMDFDIDDDDEPQSDGFIIKIAPANIQLIDVEKERASNIASDKFNLIRTVTREICAELNISYESFALEFHNFETEFQMIHFHLNSSNPIKMRLHELQKIFGSVIWVHLMNHLYTFRFSYDDQIKIVDLEYMRSLNNLFEKYMDRNIHALLAIYVSKQAIMFTEFEKSPEVCLKFTKSAFPHSLSEIYTASESNQFLLTVQKEAGLVFEQVKFKLTSIIQDCKWMSRRTKQNFLRKIFNIEGHFGDLKLKSNEWSFSDIAQIEMKPDGFLENTLTMLSTNKEFSRRFYKQYKIQQRKSKSTYGLLYVIEHLGWYVVNAFYHPLTNQIFFPLAYLHPPSYFPNVPKYVSFGNLGFVIAHEIFHGLDFLGVKYDKDGNVFGLLESKDDEFAYSERVGCFIDWYPEHFAQLLRFKLGLGVNETIKELNRISTLRENIADSGISLAYQAYKSWESMNPKEQTLPGISLNKDKVFFLSAVQLFCSTVGVNHYSQSVETYRHTPSPERINLMMMNSENFSKVFQCSPLSRMNRMHRCSLW